VSERPNRERPEHPRSPRGTAARGSSGTTCFLPAAGPARTSGLRRPAYGAAPAYTAYPQGPKTNTLAIVSLVSSLVGVFVIPVIGQIVGIITGHMSLSQIKQTGEGGRGLGLAGVIIGWVTLGLAILGIILFIAWFGVIFANAREMGYSS